MKWKAIVHRTIVRSVSKQPFETDTLLKRFHCAFFVLLSNVLIHAVHLLVYLCTYSFLHPHEYC